ncbi:MAG: Type 1 glutamine amidotransferase-like domain-containing protein [Acidimicrobiales bacterium]|jgi:cyanophycinase
MSIEQIPGPIALVGSGEYLPEMADVEAGLIAGRAPRYVQLATAAVQDGPTVVEHWHQLGIAQAKRLGVEAVIVPVNDHDDANDPAFAEMIGGAGLIYLSGGDPNYLADALRDSLVWGAIEAAWRAGSALAGCSAGAMALGAWIPSLRHPRRGSTAGLGLLPHLGILPHFDAFAARVPDLLTRFVLPDESSMSIFGVDEKTAMVGGPTKWTVQGHQSVWRLTSKGREEFPLGSKVTTLA